MSEKLQTGDLWRNKAQLKNLKGTTSTGIFWRFANCCTVTMGKVKSEIERLYCEQITSRKLCAYSHTADGKGDSLGRHPHNFDRMMRLKTRDPVGLLCLTAQELFVDSANIALQTMSLQGYRDGREWKRLERTSSFLGKLLAVNTNILSNLVRLPFMWIELCTHARLCSAIHHQWDAAHIWKQRRYETRHWKTTNTYIVKNGICHSASVQTAHSWFIAISESRCCFQINAGRDKWNRNLSKEKIYRDARKLHLDHRDKSIWYCRQFFDLWMALHRI